MKLEILGGFFVNTPFLCVTKCRSKSTSKSYKDVRSTQFEAEHQNSRFEKVVETAQSCYDRQQSPFQVMLVLHHNPKMQSCIWERVCRVKLRAR